VTFYYDPWPGWQPPRPALEITRPCGCLIDPVVFGHACRSEPPPLGTVFLYVPVSSSR